MRRAAFAVLGTAIGTSLLIGAKLGTPPPGGGSGVALDTASDTAADSPPASPKAPAGKKTTAPAKKPPASGLRDGTFAGAGANYEYGTVKVTVTVAGGKLTDVSATYPQDDPTSVGISENAIPKLRQETLKAQSAKISTVSGASLTSEAYQASLQSALDKAKA